MIYTHTYAGRGFPFPQAGSSKLKRYLTRKMFTFWLSALRNPVHLSKVEDPGKAWGVVGRDYGEVRTRAGSPSADRDEKGWPARARSV